MFRRIAIIRDHMKTHGEIF